MILSQNLRARRGLEKPSRPYALFRWSLAGLDSAGLLKTFGGRLQHSMVTSVVLFKNPVWPLPTQLLPPRLLPSTAPSASRHVSCPATRNQVCFCWSHPGLRWALVKEGSVNQEPRTSHTIAHNVLVLFPSHNCTVRHVSLFLFYGMRF